MHVFLLILIQTLHLSPGGGAVADELQVVARYQGETGGESGAEYAAFDGDSRLLYVVGRSEGVVRLDLKDPSHPRVAGILPVKGANCVAIADGVVAVAADPFGGSRPGLIHLFTSDSGRTISTVEVGYGPDMCVFTPGGRRLLVACEGEMNAHHDHPGSIALIECPPGGKPRLDKTIDFRSFDSRKDELVRDGVYFALDDRPVSQQIEPEFITVDPSGATAWVGLQENNAIATIDLVSERIVHVQGLGYQEFDRDGCAIDADSSDGKIRPLALPIKGLFQPDGILMWENAGRRFIATANEGDPRNHETTSLEELANSGLPASKAAKSLVKARPGLARLEVASAGIPERLEDEIVVLGGRSVSIWEVRESGRLERVWDSGSSFELMLPASIVRTAADPAETESQLDRLSRQRGPEPEGLAMGIVEGRHLLFVSLEKASCVAIIDVTRPDHAEITSLFNAREGIREKTVDLLDIGPEGLLFIPADQNVTEEPLLVICNEKSGTTTIAKIVH